MGVGVIYIIDFIKNQNFSWNLKAGMKVFDAELFAIKKAFKIAWENRQLNIDKVWIFLNNQAAIKRLVNSSLKVNQYYVQSIRKWAKKFQDKAI